MVGLHLTIKPSLIAAYINHICSCCCAWAKVLLQLLWHNSNNIPVHRGLYNFLSTAELCNPDTSFRSCWQSKFFELWHNIAADTEIALQLLTQLYSASYTEDTLQLLTQYILPYSWYSGYDGTNGTTACNQQLIQQIFSNWWHSIFYPATHTEVTLKQFKKYSLPTLQGKSHLCIPFLGIARPQSLFPHSCVCEQFIYSQDWSTYFLQQKRQTDPGNI